MIAWVTDHVAQSVDVSRARVVSRHKTGMKSVKTSDVVLDEELSIRLKVCLEADFFLRQRRLCLEPALTCCRKYCLDFGLGFSLSRFFLGLDFKVVTRIRFETKIENKQNIDHRSSIVLLPFNTSLSCAFL